MVNHPCQAAIVFLKCLWAASLLLACAMRFALLPLCCITYHGCLQVRLSLEVIRADVEEFGGKAYRFGKGSKDDAVVGLLKDQLDEFKQVLH